MIFEISRFNIGAKYYEMYIILNYNSPINAFFTISEPLEPNRSPPEPNSDASSSELNCENK